MTVHSVTGRFRLPMTRIRQASVVCTTRLAMVIVHVANPGLRHDRLGDLVDVPGGRQTRAEIEELADPAVRR